MLDSFTFKSVARLTIVALLSASALVARCDSFIAGNFSLELDGVNVGFVPAVQSTNPSLDAGGAKLDANFVKTMTAGLVTWQMIKFQCNVGMGKAFYDWIAAETNGNFATHNGAIILSDSQNRPVQRLEFYKSVWEEVKFSGINAASTSPGQMEVTVSAFSTSLVTPKAGQVKPPTLGPTTWLQKQYSINISDIDTSQLKALDSVSIYGKVVDSVRGLLTDIPHGPPGVNTSTLSGKLVVAQTGPGGEGPFGMWLTQAVQSGSGAGKSGSLSYTNAGGTALFTLTFPALTIVSIVNYSPTSLDYNLPLKFFVKIAYTGPTFTYGANAVGR